MLCRMRGQAAVWLAIAAGSAAGGAMRHWLTELVTHGMGPSFPWGTWVVNVSGSAAIGAVSAMAVAGWPAAWSLTARHALMTGVLGGFTTFSTFSLQTLALLQQGQVALATVYVATSVAVSVGSCIAAFVAVQALLR
jgi:CrcB protein